MKRERIEKFAKIGGFLVVAFLVSPFIWATIGGALGILTAGIIGVIVINFVPWFASALANWRLKALKYEAAKNPIETLQNDYAQKRQALIEFKQRIESTVGELFKFKGKLEGFKKKFPADAANYDKQYAQAVELLDRRKQRYKEGREKLALYEAEIERASAIWEMALATAEMNKAASVDNESIVAKIQRDTALDAVQKALGMAFADLETSLLDESGQPAAKLAVSAQQALPSPDGKPSLDLDIEVSPILQQK